MSQNHFNYMSGVPVKIAENYKPPKKLALNQNLSQRLTTSSSVTTQLLANCTYDFSLERTVLEKMSEWQHVRERNNCDRKERMCIYQKERQQQFDVKQKQMLTAVSYPSTDDLSSDDDGDDSGHGTLSDASKSAISKPIPNSTIQQQQQQQQQKQQQFSPPNCFDNILVPTVMSNHMIKSNNVTNVTSKFNTNINLQEFENNTSNPFDNIELKTINELDILAEVWNSSVAIDSIDKNSLNQTPTNEIQNHLSTQIPQNTITFNNATTSNHSQSQTSTIQSISNHFYHVNANPTNYYNNVAAINNNQTYSSIGMNQYGGDGGGGGGKYMNQMCNGQTMVTPTYTTMNNAIYNDKTVIATNPKSKSVPDIVQEIQHGLEHSQRARIRKNSQSEKKDVQPTRSSQTATPTEQDSVYRQLSISSQNLVKTISSMGFPMDRVARITSKLGKDDKKIIEHLIPLNELLDLGFDEQKISDALLKFDNNKEKALDFLIS